MSGARDPRTARPRAAGGRRGTRISAHGSVGVALAGVFIGATAGLRRWIPTSAKSREP